MGQNTNIGQENSVTVFGNPESFNKLIKNHGLLCKVKQTLVCPCVGLNHGSPDMHCTICNGEGFVYSYQRKFKVIDENSRSCNNVLYPFYNPILSVDKVQSVTSEIQGGIIDYTVDSFDDSNITVVENLCPYVKKRVTYNYDGWTYVENEKLRVDVANKLMYADGTVFDSGYQSSNPLNAYADIAKVIKITNQDTGKELKDFTVEGNLIYTNSVISENMYIDYYYADLTQAIPTDINNRNLSEEYTHDLESGECKMAFYPFVELTIGDIIVLSAVVLYKNELITHLDNLDKLFEIEVYEINDNILGSDGTIYEQNTDFILQGRHIKWISNNKPANGDIISVRYGYKPAYIIFEDNPMPNNLENKKYPTTVLTKSWSKISKDDVVRLIS
jgi:hypothetical protein